MIGAGRIDRQPIICIHTRTHTYTHARARTHRPTAPVGAGVEGCRNAEAVESTPAAASSVRDWMVRMVILGRKLEDVSG
jgi:hypothetical protein